VNRLNAVVRVSDVSSLYYDDPDYNFNVKVHNLTID